MDMHTEHPAQAPRVIRNLVYGSGTVGWGTQARERPLAMDVHLPPEDGSARLRPALVMAFGGAFHRGSKEDDSFEGEGGNTAIAEYCRRFARRGYVAVSIDYRLVTEDPAPGDTPVIQSPDDIPASRVAYVRELLGLPPATPQMLWRGMEAASDDMAAAIRFVHAHAHEWRVDPGRVAAGGFSAGARTAFNAAFGEKARVAAVVALSGLMDVRDFRHHVPGAAASPAVLLIHGANDLDYVVRQAGPLVATMRASGLPCEHATVADAGHFYLAEAQARIAGQSASCSVEQTMAGFLAAHL